MIIGLWLLQFALAETDTIIHFEVDESIVQGKSLERIEHVVDVNITFALTTTGSWYKFKDMYVILGLAYSQYVKVAYAINWGLQVVVVACLLSD